MIDLTKTLHDDTTLDQTVRKYRNLVTILGRTDSPRFSYLLFYLLHPLTNVSGYFSDIDICKKIKHLSCISGANYEGKGSHFMLTFLTKLFF